MAFDATKYKNDFAKERYASIKVNIPKAKKQVLKDLSETTGKSINRIFIEAVERVHNVDLTIVESELMQSE